MAPGYTLLGETHNPGLGEEIWGSGARIPPSAPSRATGGISTSEAKAPFDPERNALNSLLSSNPRSVGQGSEKAQRNGTGGGELACEV